jgi:hypothetical protein
MIIISDSPSPNIFGRGDSDRGVPVPQRMHSVLRQIDDAERRFEQEAGADYRALAAPKLNSGFPPYLLTSFVSKPSRFAPERKRLRLYRTARIGLRSEPCALLTAADRPGWFVYRRG